MPFTFEIPLGSTPVPVVASLRCTRVVFLLLKKFFLELETEVEVFLMMLIRLIGEDTTDGPDQQHHIHPSKPLWMRVLAMEIMRG